MIRSGPDPVTAINPVDAVADDPKLAEDPSSATVPPVNERFRDSHLDESNRTGRYCNRERSRTASRNNHVGETILPVSKPVLRGRRRGV